MNTEASTSPKICVYITTIREFTKYHLTFQMIYVHCSFFFFFYLFEKEPLLNLFFPWNYSKSFLKFVIFYKVLSKILGRRTSGENSLFHSHNCIFTTKIVIPGLFQY